MNDMHHFLGREGGSVMDYYRLWSFNQSYVQYTVHNSLYFVSQLLLILPLSLTIRLTLHYNTLRYVKCILLFLPWYVFMCISFSVYVCLSLYIHITQISLYHYIISSKYLYAHPFLLAYYIYCILYLCRAIPHRLVFNNTLSFLGMYVRMMNLNSNSSSNEVSKYPNIQISKYLSISFTHSLTHSLAHIDMICYAMLCYVY